MKYHHAIVALVLLVILGLCIVWVQVEAVEGMYEIGELTKQKDRLEEENRTLDVQIQELERLEYLIQQNEVRGLGLVSPETKLQ
ncbi:MAG: hypothetical protein NUW37_18270 [Planctomycetes bacterium]|nr:hypothetical protein [Planctomycetota bacterium]